MLVSVQQSQGQQLTLNLGYSHAIVMELPKEIKLEADTKKELLHL